MHRIALIEDDRPLLEGLGELIRLEPGFNASLLETSAEAALAKADWHQIDVVLADLDLPGASGIDLIRAVHEIRPSLPILVYTIYSDRETVFAALMAGASGYLLKGTPTPQFFTAIRDVIAGGSPMSPAIARWLLNAFRERGGASESVGGVLTARETEVLQWLAGGKLYKEMADLMGVSVNTIHTHLRKIYGKLHARGRAHALRRAKALGYLS
jgi:two-component system NarL family response regulator